MVLGAFHVIAILFYVEDDTPKEEAHVRTQTRTIPRSQIRSPASSGSPGTRCSQWDRSPLPSAQPRYSSGTRSAKFPGKSGNVWGDYSTSPASALTVFLLCWAGTNIGFTFASICEAFNRDLFGLTILSGVIMAILALVIGLGFTDLPKQPTESGIDHGRNRLAVDPAHRASESAPGPSPGSPLTRTVPGRRTQGITALTEQESGSDHHHRPAPGQPPLDILPRRWRECACISTANNPNLSSSSPQIRDSSAPRSSDPTGPRSSIGQPQPTDGSQFATCGPGPGCGQLSTSVDRPGHAGHRR